MSTKQSEQSEEIWRDFYELSRSRVKKGDYHLRRTFRAFELAQKPCGRAYRSRINAQAVYLLSNSEEPRSEVPYDRSESTDSSSVSDLEESGSSLPDDDSENVGVSELDWRYAKTPGSGRTEIEGRPTAKEVVDKLFGTRKPEERKPHTKNINAVAYALFNVLSITLDQDSNSHSNKTSPFLDLSPLYGPQADRDQHNDHSGGKIERDSVHHSVDKAEPQLSELLVQAILILFSRNHNFLVDRLKEDVPSLASRECFRIARIINRKLFIDLVIQDFMGGLLGIQTSGRKIPMNFCPTLPKTESKFLRYAASWALYSSPAFSPMEIIPDYPDKKDLSRILLIGISTPAGEPTRYNLPDKMKDKLVNLIEKGRAMKLVAFNRYRQSLYLQRYKRFNELNPKMTSGDEKGLYEYIDDVDLVVGLLCERRISDGYALGRTMTYGLLVDLANTIRSDPIHKTILDLRGGWKQNHNIDIARYWNPGAGVGVLSQLIFLHSTSLISESKNSSWRYPLILPDKIPVRRFGEIKPDRVELTTLKSIRWMLRNPSFHTIYDQHSFDSLTDGYGYLLSFDEISHHDQDQMMSLYALIPEQRFTMSHLKFLSTRVREGVQKYVTRSGVIDIAQDVIIPACTQWALEQICGYPAGMDNLKLQEHFIDLAAIFKALFTAGDLQQDDQQKKMKELKVVSQKYTTYLREEFLRITSSSSRQRSWYSSIRQVIGELFGGVLIPGQSARSGTLLARIAAANRSYKIGQFEEVVHRHLKMKHFKETQIMEEVRKLETNRVVANVLCLAVIASVQLASACTRIVQFYLDPQRKDDLDKLSDICRKGWDTDHGGGEKKARVLGFCKEAQRIGQPFSLYRRYNPKGRAKPSNHTPGHKENAQDNDLQNKLDIDLMNEGAPIELWRIKEGCIVQANFGLAHMDEMEFEDPPSVQPERKVPSLQGFGLHRCPVQPLLDDIIPEMLRHIFCLSNLRLAHSEMEQMTKPAHFHYGRVWDSFPQSLKVECKGSSQLKLPIVYKTQRNLKSVHPSQKRLWWMDILAPIILVGIAILILVFVSSGIEIAPVSEVDTALSSTWTCQHPRVFQRWTPNTVLPGKYNEPVPAEYVFDWDKPHQLSVIDIDTRDSQFAIYVDFVPQTVTSDFDFDQFLDCGEDAPRCWALGFSRRTIIVPPGAHIVQVNWIGTEIIPGMRVMDWGHERFRRFSWQIEVCD